MCRGYCPIAGAQRRRRRRRRHRPLPRRRWQEVRRPKDRVFAKAPRDDRRRHARGFEAGGGVGRIDAYLQSLRWVGPARQTFIKKWAEPTLQKKGGGGLAVVYQDVVPAERTRLIGGA
jgi:hypothetical protein